MLRLHPRKLCALAGALAASCAPVAAPPPVAPGPAVGPAPVHAALRLCPDASSYGMGGVGLDGALLVYEPWIATPAGPLLRNPTDGACVSSGFASRPEDLGGNRWHSGLDLSNRQGGMIYSAGAGTIVLADWRGSYGLMIEIDHGQGVRTRYAHLAEVDLAIGLGDVVGPGWPIGRMGRTGNATGVHLHYEVLIGGRAVDPLFYNSN